MAVRLRYGEQWSNSRLRHVLCHHPQPPHILKAMPPRMRRSMLPSSHSKAHAKGASCPGAIIGGTNVYKAE